jgi:hypothetical protein
MDGGSLSWLTSRFTTLGIFLELDDTADATVETFAVAFNADCVLDEVDCAVGVVVDTSGDGSFDTIACFDTSD